MRSDATTPKPLGRIALTAALLAAAVAWVGPATGSSLTDFLVQEGLVSPEAAAGADLFFRGTFGGNGRTCGSCHPVANNLTLDPAFIGGLPADDPLFVAEDEENGVPGLERPVLMRQFGLILENLDGFEDPTNKFVMRSVPHTLSLGITLDPPADGRAPVERTGWSGDGAPGDGSLLNFSAGAVRQHFTKTLLRDPDTDFEEPTPVQLQRMETYMRSVGRSNEPSISAMTFTETRATNGRDLFLRSDPQGGRCRFCHQNAGANSNIAIDGGQGNHNLDTGVERAPNPARLVETFPIDGGFGTDPDPSDPDVYGDLTFNVPPLIEAADTAPFFHNNIAATLEDAVKFYSRNPPGPNNSFNESPAAAAFGTINLTDEQSETIAAFLRVLNSAFNIAIAKQRSEAAASLIKKPQPIPCDPLIGCPDPPPSPTPAVIKLLELANEEAEDARRVLDEAPVDLNPLAIARLQEAIDLNEQAIAAPNDGIRKQRILQAIAKLDAARSNLGTGFNFQLGEGNLLF
jgi:cytochrome c peroxidase